MIYDSDKIERLIERLVNSWRDAVDLDGSDLQEWLVEAGVLEEVIVSEPCREDCACAEFYGQDQFPVTCYRRVRT